MFESISRFLAGHKQVSPRPPRRVQPQLEGLEDRALMSAYLYKSDIYIKQTNRNDRAFVSFDTASNRFKVEDNGRVRWFAKSQVRGGDVMYFGYGGNDHFTNTTSLRTNAWGGSGHDKLYAGLSRARLFGEDGRDSLYGNLGNDMLHGGNSDDQLHGNSGDDTRYGGSGHDSLHGGAGVDRLHGQAGNDWLVGGPDNYYDNDYLHGGLGADKFERPSVSWDHYMDFSLAQADEVVDV